jgi:quercetin 2,3-dioxygenase
VHVDDPVIQTVPLGFQWPTVDPFLFCVHHLDAYPAGNDRLGPAVPLDGRDLGQDFAGIDGWRMYHGQAVPGFPRHPHRGFETVTFVRQGLIDHADSLGATARFGRGDVQWLTAGGGIEHCEMFPLIDRGGPNPVELFQIWLNLPAADKMVEPHFTMLWDGDIPRHVAVDEAGRTTVVTVIAGALAGLTPPAPPPHSWASRPDSELAIWHLRLEPGATWELPATEHDDVVRMLYVFEGAALEVGDHRLETGTGAQLRSDQPVAIRSVPTADADARVAATDQATECLVLAARPIGEPVAQYGPFVMNTEDEIRQAFADYRRTEFGGWPWAVDDPVHDAAQSRFARHGDGRTESARDHADVAV